MFGFAAKVWEILCQWEQVKPFPPSLESLAIENFESTTERFSQTQSKNFSRQIFIPRVSLRLIIYTNFSPPFLRSKQAQLNQNKNSEFLFLLSATNLRDRQKECFRGKTAWILYFLLVLSDFLFHCWSYRKFLTVYSATFAEF